VNGRIKDLTVSTRSLMDNDIIDNENMVKRVSLGLDAGIYQMEKI
jgi:hypothetical protein